MDNTYDVIKMDKIEEIIFADVSKYTAEKLPAETPDFLKIPPEILDSGF